MKQNPMTVTFQGIEAKRDVQGVVIGPDKTRRRDVRIRTTEETDGQGRPLICLEIVGGDGIYVRAEDLAGAAIGVARVVTGCT
jgi:hypothetical protein